MRLSLFLAILTIQLQAQTFISGTVLDATDFSPIDFAHVILLSQQHIGAITSEFSTLTKNDNQIKTVIFR